MKSDKIHTILIFEDDIEKAKLLLMEKLDGTEKKYFFPWDEMEKEYDISIKDFVYFYKMVCEY